MHTKHTNINPRLPFSLPPRPLHTHIQTHKNINKHLHINTPKHTHNYIHTYTRSREQTHKEKNIE